MSIYKIRKHIIITMMVLSALSCSDYLDLKPISEEIADDAYTSASQIEAALNGAYESFRSDAYIWNNILWSDVRSDNYYAGGDNAEIFQMDYLKISATNSKVEQSWSNIFNAILKANTVILEVQQNTDPLLTSNRKEEILGEALFLRALHYFNLVKLYGGVPLITEPTRTTDPAIIYPERASVNDVYNQILIDLEEAASLLPDIYGGDASVNKARATAGAANALAAKAAAQNRNFSQALEYITLVEQSEANYTLLADYSYLFDGNHYNNTESIMEVQFLGGDIGNWAPQMLLPPSISGDTWRKFITPSQNLISTFDDEGDNIRKNASVLFESVDWVDEYWQNESGTSIPFAYKWKNAMGWASTDRQYILRYGDIVLLKAECLNETDNQSQALIVLNSVRSRVSLPALSLTDKSELRNAILKERRLELAQEGQRWDDLARHNMLLTVMNNLEEIDLRTNQATDYDMTEAKTLLPIPQSELDRNAKLTQNPL